MKAAHTAVAFATSAQKTKAVKVRPMPQGNLVAVARELLKPDMSRPHLNRCLRRHGVSKNIALRPQTPTGLDKAF